MSHVIMTDGMTQPTARLQQDAGGHSDFEIVANSMKNLSAPWTFADLIRPLTTDQFFGDYWARQPLFIRRGNSEFYRDLISLGELEQYLAVDELFTKHSVSAAARQYGRPEPPPVSVIELYERMLKGSSLRMRRLECLMHPNSPAIRLLRQMETDLQHPSDSLSCYVSPPEAVGLGPHYDETEIFTLQVLGTKRWRLYHQIDSNRSGILQPEDLGAPTQDFVLEPGDFFYLPRGLVHDVTSDAPSFSLTIVFNPVKWSSVLDQLSRQLATTSAFIQPMPAGVLFSNNRPASFRQELESRLEMIRQALEDFDVESWLDGIATQSLQKKTVPPDGQLEALFSLEMMTAETLLERRPGIVCHLARNEDSVVLVLPGGYSVTTSTRAEYAIREVLASNGPFRVRDLHESLSDSAKLALAKKLVGFGLVRTVKEQPA